MVRPDCYKSSEYVSNNLATVSPTAKHLHVSSGLATLGLIAKQRYTSRSDTSTTTDIRDEQLYASITKFVGSQHTESDLLQSACHRLKTKCRIKGN